MNGGSTINITGQHALTNLAASTGTSVLRQLVARSWRSMIPSPQSNRSCRHIGGNSNINFNGTIYCAERDCDVSGQSTFSVSTTCGQLIAKLGRVQRQCHLDNSNGAQRHEAATSSPVCAVGAMMRKLDQRGVAALEFCLVAVPLFTLMFAIFDLGRYAITMQSLRMLANAGARA